MQNKYKNHVTGTYKPNDYEDYMCPSQVQYFRQKLTHWRQELEDESRETLLHLREENWNEPDINDRASMEVDVGLELRSKDRLRKLIEKINIALEKIENGTYGFCEETGEPIGVRRLEARPIATLSIEAQNKHEQFELLHNDE